MNTETTNLSTGPRTEAGKATSSRNATKTGLFTSQPFIAPGEAEEYAQAQTSLITQLAPEGILEQTFANEIMSATWRLRRCCLLESQTNESCDSINRARAQANNALRRALSELRRLQTERATRIQLPDLRIHGVADTRAVLNNVALHNKQIQHDLKTNDLDTLEGLIRQADHRLGMKTTTGQTFDEAFPDHSDSSFCKTSAASMSTPANTPRNALCPCKSGQKFKRCCGTQAPPVLHAAA